MKREDHYWRHPRQPLKHNRKASHELEHLLDRNRPAHIYHQKMWTSFSLPQPNIGPKFAAIGSTLLRYR
jgi:hypothetical protein